MTCQRDRIKLEDLETYWTMSVDDFSWMDDARVVDGGVIRWDAVVNIVRDDKGEWTKRTN